MSGEKKYIDKNRLSSAADSLQRVREGSHKSIKHIAEELADIFQDQHFVEKDFAVTEDMQKIANRLTHQLDQLKKMGRTDSSYYKVIVRDMEYAKQRVTYLKELSYEKQKSGEYKEGGYDISSQYASSTPSLSMQDVSIKTNSVMHGENKVHVDTDKAYLEPGKKYHAQTNDASFFLSMDEQGVLHVTNPMGNANKPLSFEVETHYTPKNDTRKGGVTVKSTMTLSLESIAVKKSKNDTNGRDNTRVPFEKSLMVIPKKSSENPAQSNVVTTGPMHADPEDTVTPVAQPAQQPVAQPVTPSKNSLDDYFDIYDDDADRAKENAQKKATISDVERVYREKAEHEAEEVLRKEYEAIGQLKMFTPNTWKTWTRMKTYWMRGERRNKAIKNSMQQHKDKAVDLQRGEVTSAADRHERMYDNRNENKDIKKVADGVSIPEINDLCKTYLADATLTDAEFEKKFNAIVAKNPEVKKALKKNVDYSASNILLKLRSEKQYRILINVISKEVNSYAARPDAAVYTAAVKKAVDTYVTETHQALAPNVQKAMLAPANVDKYKRWISHEKALLNIQSENLKIKLDVLKGGKGAYEIDNKDRNKNILAKLGNLMDKYPKTSLTIGIAGSVLAGLATGGAGLAAVATGKAMVGIAARKAAHVTKEQMGEEKRLTRGLDAESSRLKNLRDIMNSSSWFKRNAAIGSAEYKATRQYQLYGQTTQFEFMSDTDATYGALKNAIVANDKNTIKTQSAEALARLDYYAKSGHNFFGQQKDESMEEKMNALQILVLSSVLQADTTLEDIRNDASYKDTYNTIDTGYTDTRKKFKTQRAILAGKYAAATGAASIGLQYLLGTGLFEHGHNAATDSVTDSATSSSGYTATKLNENIVSGFNLSDAQASQLEGWFSSSSVAGSHNPNAFWSALHDMKVPGEMSEQAFNELKNNFMGELAWKMQENGVAELINAPAALALDTHAEGYSKAMSFLVKHGICESADGPAIVHNLAQVKAGVLDPTSLSTDMQRKMAEYCYMFLHKDPSQGLGNGLLQASFHQEWIQNPAESVKDFTSGGSNRWQKVRDVMTVAGIPIFANTFLENVQFDQKKLAERKAKKGMDTDEWNPDIIVDPGKENIDAAWIIKPEDAKLFGTTATAATTTSAATASSQQAKNTTQTTSKNPTQKTNQTSNKNPDSKIVDYKGFDDSDALEDDLKDEINKIKNSKNKGIEATNSMLQYEYSKLSDSVITLGLEFQEAKKLTDNEQKLKKFLDIQSKLTDTKISLIALRRKTLDHANSVKASYPQQARELETLANEMYQGVGVINKILDLLNEVTEKLYKDKFESTIDRKHFNMLRGRSDDLITEVNQMPTDALKLENLRIKGVISPIEIDGKKYDYFVYHGRPIVHVKIGKLIQPFYLSTGDGGKKDVAKNKWYPFFGIGNDGWINKGTSKNINDYYENKVFYKISKILNGTLNEDPKAYQPHKDAKGRITELQEKLLDSYQTLWTESQPAMRQNGGAGKHITHVLKNVNEELKIMNDANDKNQLRNPFNNMKNPEAIKKHLQEIGKEYHLMTFSRPAHAIKGIKEEGVLWTDKMNVEKAEDLELLLKRMQTSNDAVGIYAVPKSVGNTDEQIRLWIARHAFTTYEGEENSSYLKPELNVGIFNPRYKEFSFEKPFHGDLKEAKKVFEQIEAEAEEETEQDEINEENIVASETTNNGPTEWIKGKSYFWNNGAGNDEEVELTKIKKGVVTFKQKDGTTFERTIDQLNSENNPERFDMIYNA